MVSSEVACSPQPPPLGTLIDDDSLELVEVLGYGGYGVVYRAVDVYSQEPISYAVKCLPHSSKRNATRQRQLHLREITLHQLASAHPNVVTLHRVIEDPQYTYIVMDYCEDGDLFSQILHHRRYLGNNELIKDVFLQLLDAVEYCHSLHIYHRDLKPENVLCFDGGLRLAITDFGLATTETVSTEFRTGSVYHMSPECQGGVFAPTRTYSPLFNDIWSLGIILLNLITGRNPWKSAAADDCTFQAYLRDPLHFLPTVLPISEEVNMLLVRTLEVDWRRRITLREMRAVIKGIENFYSPDVLFEDSMARCPWEAGIRAESESESSSEEIEPEPQERPHDEALVSSWTDSDSEMVFATQSETDRSWAAESLRAQHDSYGRSMSPSPASPLFAKNKLFDALDTPSNPSTYSVVSSSPSIPSLPRTPGPDSNEWSQANRRPVLRLNVDMNNGRPSYYDDSVMMISARSSSMHTALESQMEAYGMYSPYLSAVVPDKTSYLMSATQAMDIETPATGNADVDAKSTYTYPTIDGDTSTSALRTESPILGVDNLGSTSGETTAIDRFSYNWDRPFSPHNSPDTTGSYSFLDFSPTPTSPRQSLAWYSSFSFLSSEPRAAGPTPQASFFPPPASPAPLPIRPPPSPARERKRTTSTLSFLGPLKLAFPRRSSSPIGRSTAIEPRAYGHSDSAPAALGTNWAFSQSTSSGSAPQPYLCLPPATADHAQKAEPRIAGTQRARQRKRLRSARAWFSPGKLFSAVLT
ncbi:kinase-like protein [Daedalea quercina L-15889]|uniref:Kinase-like protein n=1 Tax=Daedalea quercina L-15889 TaxID=1314783 RepID=A0A165M699_9APHY|nr:kinase-like protein [Daedalea quercina L-15889]